MGIQPCAKHFSPAVRKYFLSALALRLKTWSNHDVHPPTSLLGFFERKCLSLCLYYNPTVGVCVCVCACRCQTAPCEECEYHGQSHTVGDRWRSDQCQLCRCLPNLTVQCSPYCPYAATGCPQVRGCVWLLFIFVGRKLLKIFPH